MEPFEQFLTELNIDLMIVVMVLAGGFFSTTYLKSWKWANDAWKTLIVGSVFSAAYVLVVFLEKEMTAQIWKSSLVSYVFATSFYELVIKWIKEKIEGFFPPKQ